MEILSRYPAWRVVGGAFERDVTLEDAFAAHDLAARLAFVADKAGVHPRFVLGSGTLQVRSDVRSKPEPSEAEAQFVEKAEALLERRQKLLLDRNPRPARALIRLWLEAQDLLEAELHKLRPEDLPRPVRPGVEVFVFDEIAKHPVAAGFSYLAWIRGSLGLPDTNPPYTRDHLLGLATLEEVFEAFAALRLDLEATVAGIPEGMMERRAFLSRWGGVFDVDQMLEHAVMHLHRHRLQLLGYLESRDKG